MRHVRHVQQRPQHRHDFRFHHLPTWRAQTWRCSVLVLWYISKPVRTQVPWPPYLLFMSLDCISAAAKQSWWRAGNDG